MGVIRVMKTTTEHLETFTQIYTHKEHVIDSVAGSRRCVSASGYWTGINTQYSVISG